MTDKEIFSHIRSFADKDKQRVYSRFFKSGNGEYGEGDKFLGLTVPVSRKLASDLKDITYNQIDVLINSEYHEERLIALIILYKRFEKFEKEKNELECKKIYEYYLAQTSRINNWDLVDLSCYHIVGKYLLNKDRKVLEKLAKSELLWDRRIAMISTYAFIDNGETKDTFKIADILLNDKHDLIHKAVGWMLREAGKKVSVDKLKEYLKTRYMKMPRTMLRYSIEKFPEKERRKYIEGLI